MKTILKSASVEVTIDTEGPVIMIGEKINPTGRKKLTQMLKDHNLDYVKDIALAQVAAGADVLDINVGAPGVDEVALLPEVVKLVQSITDVPLCLDSANPKALAAGLAVVEGRPLINSVNGEEATLQAVLPVVKEFGAAVIGLTMDDDGIPSDAETRVAIAEKILERAAKMGIPSEDVVIDCLVMTVGADDQAAAITLRTIEMVRQAFGVNINLGASNVSFGLPERHVLNQAFLALTAKAGASCVITDAKKLSSVIRAADLMLGRDPNGRRYLKNWRNQEKLAKAAAAQ